MLFFLPPKSQFSSYRVIKELLSCALSCFSPGQEQLSRLEEMLSFEKDRNNNLQQQLDALSFSSKRKVSKAKGPEKLSLAYDNIGTKELVISEAEQTANTTSVDKPPSKDAQPLKGSQRAVPAHRRAKARGVSLQDNEDDDGK
ncbi:uncharacterized protein LOC110116387 [Dendrobium catenatum]|uniref:uncharacterized protein LOC110116387 n=1 Tax=Dendrobium catenatum TaxID=906689 RepID=UPI0009F5B1E5|nr:uncharacterized protein LOC110116387 [Dendrobium catenatum]